MSTLRNEECKGKVTYAQARYAEFITSLADSINQEFFTYNTNMRPINSDTFQQMLLQLRKSFLDEMSERLDRLEILLIEMEKNGAGSDAFNEFYRTIHSLKGSGGTHGLHIITSICHQLEDLLSTIGTGTKYTSEFISASLNYVDLLRMTTDQIQAGKESFPKVEEQLNKLRKRIAQKLFTVLLVDNSPLSTSIYLQILSTLPVQTVVMNDGLYALRRALTEHFDLVITANEIPVLSGVALIGALKLSDSKNRNTKTILITSSNKRTLTQNPVTDADYVIFKDAKLAQNLADMARRALSANNGIAIDA